MYRKVVENAFGISVSRFRAKGVVLQYMLRTHQCGEDRAPTPANDIVALKITSIIWVHWLSRRTGSEMGATLGMEEAGM